ncbi:MAG: DUF6525 family protein [Pseudomonadota bacterium]
MRRNLGQSTLRRRRKAGDPMQEYDRLPPELRRWLSMAVLPWRAASVRRCYERAYARTGDAALALQELDAIEARRLAKDLHALVPPERRNLSKISVRSL